MALAYVIGCHTPIGTVESIFLSARHAIQYSVSYCYDLSFGLGKLAYLLLDYEWECSHCEHVPNVPRDMLCGYLI